MGVIGYLPRAGKISVQKEDAKFWEKMKDEFFKMDLSSWTATRQALDSWTAYGQVCSRIFFFTNFNILNPYSPMCRTMSEFCIV